MRKSTKFINQLHEVARMQQLAGLKAINELNSEKQDLFIDWVKGQREVDNNIEAEFPEELQGDDKIAWEKYLELVTKFPNADREDIAVAISAVYFAGFEFEDSTWNDEQTARDVYNYLRGDELNENKDNEIVYSVKLIDSEYEYEQVIYVKGISNKKELRKIGLENTEFENPKKIIYNKLWSFDELDETEKEMFNNNIAIFEPEPVE